MPIRPATLADVPALVELASQMHALTRFKAFAFNAQRTAESLASLVQQQSGKYLFVVAQNNQEKIVGGLIAVIEQHIFSDALTASIMNIVVLPQARMGGYGVRLLKAFEGWAKNRRVTELYFGVNSQTGVAQIETMALRMGYEKVGGNYAKRN
jgi:N-acetylglutamate synthase-like GNAT family acetyltransferase